MIFLDTNVVSETLRQSVNANVEIWLARHHAELAISTVVLAELAFGVEKIRPDERAKRLEIGVAAWRQRLAERIFPFSEEAALVYGAIMGSAVRRGTAMSVPDGMIAAIARIEGGRLATRNGRDFRDCGLEIIDPWAP